MHIFGTTEAYAGAIILRQASIAGGSGACYAPDGEREGRSPLAFAKAHMLRQSVGSARGKARSHPSLEIKNRELSGRIED